MMHPSCTTILRRSYFLLLTLTLTFTIISPIHAFSIHRPPSNYTPSSITWSQWLDLYTPAPFSSQPYRPASASPNSVRLTILHANDLYELLPVGRLGGISRVSTLYKQLYEVSPNTISLLAGDLFSPSALSTVVVNLTDPSTNTTKAEKLDGIQMVNVLSAFNLSYSTLGNHETDVSATQYTKLINQAKFGWICANARNQDGLNTDEMVEFVVEEDGTNTSTTIQVGIFGLTLDSNNKPYQNYSDITSSLAIAKTEVQSLQTRGADIVVALTHLPYWHDQTLSKTVSGIHLVVGGHEHQRIAIPGNLAAGIPSIYKADSDVQSVWIHDMFLDVSLEKNNTQYLVIQSSLVDIDSSIPDDPILSSIVSEWITLGFNGFRAIGFQPSSFLANITEDLVGDTEVIFTQDTVLTEIVNEACLNEVGRYNLSDSSMQVQASLFNSGAIRIDDTIHSGTTMIEYDALRLTPYLNSVILVNMSGELLVRTLRTSELQQGNSQFLHYSPNITKDVNSISGYLINGVPIVPNTLKWYNVGVLKYLLTGVKPYTFLVPSPQNMQLSILAGDPTQNDPLFDVRRSVIEVIRQRYVNHPIPTGTSSSSSTGTNTPTTDGGDDEGPRIMGLPHKIFYFLLFSACFASMILCGIWMYKKGYCCQGLRREAEERRRDAASPSSREAAREHAVQYQPFLDESQSRSVQRDRSGSGTRRVEMHTHSSTRLQEQLQSDEESMYVEEDMN